MSQTDPAAPVPTPAKPKSRGRQIGCAILAVVGLICAACAGFNFYQYTVQQDNYEAGHAAYLNSDCATAVPLYEAAISGGGLGGDSNEAAKASAVEKAECDELQKAVDAQAGGDVGPALTGYADFLAAYPTTPLSPTVRSQTTSLFAQAEVIAAQSDQPVCQSFEALRAQELVPAGEAALPPLLLACGQVYEDNNDPTSAIDLYQLLLSDYPDHPLAEETTVALARASVAEAQAMGAGNIPAPQSVGGSGSGPSVVVIQNDSPEKLSIVFSGPEARIEELEPCTTCTNYTGDGPESCPEQGPIGTYELPAGDYDVVVKSISDEGVTPFTGQWNLATGDEYYSCFFLVTTIQ
jgi:hypothetical protein